MCRPYKIGEGPFVVTICLTKMDQICMIMDMEGYFIPKFHCRELGAVSLSDETSINLFYKLPISFLELSPPQATTVTFVKKRIHGLPFFPAYQEEARPYEQLQKDINDMYNIQVQGNKKLIAYKGGHVEKDLLKELELPCVDLESFGCPKVETLIHEGYGEFVNDCGHHFRYRLPKVTCIHCAMMEVQILKEWVEEQLDINQQ